MRKRSICEWAEIAGLGEHARALADSALDTRTFAQTLAGPYPEDAVRLLAHLLPNRQGVLWAWSCAKMTLAADAAPVFQTCLMATEKWMVQPSDENRRAAMSAAQHAQVGTPAGAAGLAAFLSGESLAPAGAHPVPPAEYLASKAVAASIMLAAITTEPEKAGVKYREFLMRGFELAQRTQLWESAAALTRTE